MHIGNTLDASRSPISALLRTSVHRYSAQRADHFNLVHSCPVRITPESIELSSTSHYYYSSLRAQAQSREALTSADELPRIDIMSPSATDYISSINGKVQDAIFTVGLENQSCPSGFPRCETLVENPLSGSFFTGSMPAWKNSHLEPS